MTRFKPFHCSDVHITASSKVPALRRSSFNKSLSCSMRDTWFNYSDISARSDSGGCPYVCLCPCTLRCPTAHLGPKLRSCSSPQSGDGLTRSLFLPGSQSSLQLSLIVNWLTHSWPQKVKERIGKCECKRNSNFCNISQNIGFIFLSLSLNFIKRAHGETGRLNWFCWIYFLNLFSFSVSFSNVLQSQNTVNFCSSNYYS